MRVGGLASKKSCSKIQVGRERSWALESKLHSRLAPAFITKRPSADLHCSLTKTLESRPQPSEPLGPWLQALWVVPGAGPDLAPEVSTHALLVT